MRTLIELWDGCWRIAQDVQAIDVKFCEASEYRPAAWLVYIVLCEDAKRMLDRATWPISCNEFSKDFTTEPEARAAASAIGKRIADAMKPEPPPPHYIPYPVAAPDPLPPQNPWGIPVWCDSTHGLTMQTNGTG